MISPRHLRLLIRHFDSIDQVVASRLDSARPWLETALTQQLCDLLDDKLTDRDKLTYSRHQLRLDLAESEEALSIQCQVDAIQYKPLQERYVTQSDIGLIVRYRNRFTGETHETTWLLQAKRAKPDLSRTPCYSHDSGFQIDPKQHERIERMEQIVGTSFVKYLFYAPRPRSLSTWDRGRLATERNAALVSHIYDYVHGQLLFQEVQQSESSLSAGIFVADPNSLPATISAMHRSITREAWPFSWFIAGCLTTENHWGTVRSSRSPHSPPDPRTRNPMPVSQEACEDRIRRIVTGDLHEVDRLIIEMNEVNDADSVGPFLPAQTMTVEVAAGGTLGDRQL